MSFTKPNSQTELFALVDCNNFYASCERVFHPKLKNRPIVVLSNNDGCIIARSNEAKALGIPMGAPLFQYRDMMERCGVTVCSSNYVLYGDLSHRVMETLRSYSSDMEVYSIDEAFLLLDRNTCVTTAIKARRQVGQWTGIPVSVGLARTKTLAKVANRIAKKGGATEGVHLLEDPAEIRKHLSRLPVTEIWGIGTRLGNRLARFGIRTAQQFADAEDLWIRRHFHVTGLRTAYELRGISCIPLEEAPPPKKSICCSRSFGRPITEEEELFEAISTYTCKASEKLRREKSRASAMTLFAVLHPFSLHETAHIQVVLPEPTHYTPLLLHYAKYAMHKLFRPGRTYRKVGVILEGLVSGNDYQPSLFAKRPTREQEELMFLVDRCNKGKEKKQILFAAEGIRPEWKMHQERCTQRYTTRWSELLTIKI